MKIRRGCLESSASAWLRVLGAPCVRSFRQALHASRAFQRQVGTAEVREVSEDRFERRLPGGVSCSPAALPGNCVPVEGAAPSAPCARLFHGYEGAFPFVASTAP